MLSKADYFKRLNTLGRESAQYLSEALPQALRAYPRVLVLTHVPPFREACWHEGQISDDDFLPYFTCKAVGDVLRSNAQRFPKSQIEMLCGHTHGQGTAQIRPNLLVRTGGATYGAPEIQRVFAAQ